MSICVELHLEGKHVLIVGGGKVAYRKAQQYVQEKAKVTIVSPHIEEPLQELPIHILLREYQSEDLNDMFLVYAATNHKLVNQQVLLDAQKRNILCGCAEKHATSSMSSMVCIEDFDILCAISTHGKYPYYHHDIKKAIEPYLQECTKKIPLLEILRNHILTHHLEKHLLSQLASHSIAELEFLVSAIQKKKVILFAFHGVAKEKIISNLYQDCDSYTQASDVAYGIVFMSEKTRKKLHDRVSGLQSMISLLQDFAIPQIRVISMLLTDGHYHQQAKQICESWQVGISEALFQTQERLDAMIDEYVHYYQKQNQLLFVLHEHDSIKIEQLCRSIQRYSDIYSCSFQEEVSIDKSKSVLIIPFVMFMGHHALHDIVEGSRGMYAKLLHQNYDVTVLHSSIYDQPFTKKLWIENIKNDCLF